MLEVFAVHLKEPVTDDMFDRLMTWVPVSRREKINRFRFKIDKHRTLIGDTLVRYVLSKKLGQDPRRFCFKHNSYGKPYLVDHNSIHFNISHSGEWVVGAFDTIPVGIDVEEIKPIDFAIIERFFSQAEIRDFSLKTEQEKPGYFFDLWSLKESFIKAEGKGLSIALDSFSVRFKDRDIFLERNGIPDNSCFFKQYEVDSNHKMAVCAGHSCFPAGIVFETPAGFLEKSTV